MHVDVGPTVIAPSPLSVLQLDYHRLHCGYHYRRL